MDAITFTSSSTVRYTIEGLAQSGLDESRAIELLNKAAVVCIGPITAATAEACGLNVTAVADIYTADGLVEALVLLFAIDKRS
jgi:uroporphyrinogen III methyltransferase/synthase